MPKLDCPCGYVHDLSPIPDGGWLTIRDSEYEKVRGAEIGIGRFAGVPVDDTADAQDYDRDMRLVTQLTGRLYECPKCGRLMWTKRPGAPYAIYVRQESK